MVDAIIPGAGVALVGGDPRSRERFGTEHLIGILRGEDTDKIRQFNHRLGAADLRRRQRPFAQ